MNNSDTLLMNGVDLYSLFADNEMSDEQFDKIKVLLKNNKAVRDHYYRIVNLEVLLRDSEGLGEESEENFDSRNMVFWNLLAQEENIAPAIEIPKEELQRELIQKVVYPPREKQQMSKFSIFSLIMSAAAILFMVLFLRFAPDNRYRVEVATLLDQVDTEWAQPETSPETGSRLWAHEAPLQLNKGIVKIRYDQGVELLIEGPAVFEVQRAGLYLEYGRLYSRVSDGGLGYTVTTPTSQFVDHGTEFCVQADINGSSELHVIKGKVQLFAGSNGKIKSGQMISENMAVRYNANIDQIKDITVSEHSFVRNINSKGEMVWRGQTRIDLGDIASGGNGLVTTRRPVSIHPNTGAFSLKVEDFEGEGDIAYHTGDFTYHPIKENAFVDGVFVPSNKQESPQITSAGHVFADCPSTGNTFWESLFYTKYFKTDQRGINFISSLGANKQDALYMHSNSGITFDLDKIRLAYSFGSIKEFRSACLLNRKRSNPSPTDARTADFWVLVDGQVRYRKMDVSHSETAYPIQFEIYEQDRFLSLAVTDGSDDNASSDWGYFIEPVLVFEGN